MDLPITIGIVHTTEVTQDFTVPGVILTGITPDGRCHSPTTVAVDTGILTTATILLMDMDTDALMVTDLTTDMDIMVGVIMDPVTAMDTPARS